MIRRLSILAISAMVATALLVSGVAAVSPFQVHGSHYNLNIIGAKTYDDALGKEVGDSMGHTLFVKLNGHSRITMTQATDGVFQVTDRNGCDGEAEFIIAPGYYNVYARALGKPNGRVDISASGEFLDALTGETIIPLGVVQLTRESGKPQSVNINELFYVDVPLCTAAEDDLCTETTTYTDSWVFDIVELLSYWWDYNNDGMKTLQVRFYGCTLDPTGEAPGYCRWANGDPIVSTKNVVAF